MNTIGALDYIVIALSLFLSTSIGIYFAVCGGRQKTSDEYFLGNRQMSALPIAASLVVSVMSAIAYLGTPAEIYMTGPKYALYIISRFIAMMLVTTLFLPVFYRLNITSIYEYLDRRFNKLIRYSVICCTTIHGFIYLGIVLYTPALALSTATGLTLPTSILSIGVVCTFYTTIGGFKAVIWTDVFQAVVMTLSLIIMIIVGSIAAGGPSVGWQRAIEGQRSDLIDFSVDPTRTYTFWSIMIGGVALNLTTFGMSQSYVQRYNSCKTEKQAKLAAWLGVTGVSFIDLLGVIMGMVMYSLYMHCDPVTSGAISRPDEMLPFFMMDIFGRTPGMTGFLIAGAFCASLSSVSSIVNSLAAITGQDIIKVVKKDISESQYTIAIKMCSACYGVLGIAIAFLASAMGNVLETALSVAGVLYGPGFGVFCLGIFFPRSHSNGVLCGLLAGIFTALIFFIGSQVSDLSSHHHLPFYTHGCQEQAHNTTFYTELPSTVTHEMTTASTNSDSFNLFGLSFLYYSFLGTLVTVVVGYAFSRLLTGPDCSTIDPQLISPVLFEHFPSFLPNGLKYQKTAQEKNDNIEI